MQVKPIKTRIFRENEDLVKFIFKYVKKIPDRSVLVISSKIAALAEGRTVSYKNAKEKVIQKTAFIKKESSFAVQTRKTWLTIRDGMILASAGIDESNADGKLILLPKNSFKYAEILRK